MLKGQDIICISSIDWDFIWQGHQEIMSKFAENGNKVLFIENTGIRMPTFQDLPRLRKRIYHWFHSVKGIRKERDNLYVYSPLILPFPYSRIARWVNKHLLLTALRRWLRSIGFSDPVIWAFLPTGLTLDIISALDSKIIIYYCIDNFSASSPIAKKVERTEKEVIRRSDIVFVTAKNLYDKCIRYNKNVYTFPFGVDTEVYEKTRDKPPEAPRDMASIKRPIIGYVGGIHKWIDFGLIKYMAENSPDKSFVFVGPLQKNVDDLKAFANIHFLGQKRYKDLPGYIMNFDSCIIPYLITDYTKDVYPTKINEYLSLGKPVISTLLPEVKAFNERNGDIVYIAKDKKDFLSLVDSALLEKKDAQTYNKRIKIAAQEGSWSAKIDKMCELIDKKISQKEREKSLRWRDNILALYDTAKRKVVPAIAGVCIAYIVLFYTPFIWWVAEPLKIEDGITKADCIIVPAGGVGESGRAGQGYEERVKYAVELYKKGLGDHLIFSSGYRYAFRETSIMKALAVSLDVPADRIILEDKARNTYENVLYPSKIMTEKGWGSAIVVSSPYHMKRFSMVWKKLEPDRPLMAAPVKNSLFFKHDKGITLEQIHAIIHEYVGIVYYKIKGYI